MLKEEGVVYLNAKRHGMTLINYLRFKAFKSRGSQLLGELVKPLFIIIKKVIIIYNIYW